MGGPPNICTHVVKDKSTFLIFQGALEGKGVRYIFLFQGREKKRKWFRKFRGRLRCSNLKVRKNRPLDFGGGRGKRQKYW